MLHFFFQIHLHSQREHLARAHKVLILFARAVRSRQRGFFKIHVFVSPNL